MGQPNSAITFGVPLASSDGRYYSRYPNGDAVGTPGNAPGGLQTATASGVNGIASSAASFAPDVVFYFNGTPGAPIGSYSASGGSVQTAYAGGYGGRYSSTYTRGGRATSAELSIAAGSDGDPADTLDGVGHEHGLFGINLSLPPSVQCVAGDTLHTLIWIRVPASFNYRTNTGLLKFLRHYAVSPSPVYGHLDTWIAMPGYIPGEGGDYNLANGNQSGWARGNESDHNAEYYRSGYGFESGIVTNTPRLITRDQWVCVEIEQVFSTTIAGASHRIWVDGLFVCEWRGTEMAWINAAGVRQALTGCAGATSIAEGITINALRVFTYFNAFSPQDQLLHVDCVAFTKNRVSEMPATDAYGNKLMGTAVV